MLTRRTRVRAFREALLTGFLVMGISSAGQATPLDVELKPYPVILANYINSIAYDSALETFEVVGWTSTLDVGTGQTSYFNDFRLQASINNLGVASGGNFLVSGFNTGVPPTTLLRSLTLSQFGFDPVAGGTIEFLFAPTITGSLIDDNTFDATLPLDITLSGLMPSVFVGSWTQSFSATYTSGQAMLRSDPPPATVPEPATLILMLVGAGGLSTRLRRRRTGKGPDAHA